jgi:hypothetical protein
MVCRVNFKQKLAKMKVNQFLSINSKCQNQVFGNVGRSKYLKNLSILFWICWFGKFSPIAISLNDLVV